MLSSLSDNEEIKKIYENYNDKVILSVNNMGQKYIFFNVPFLTTLSLIGFLIFGSFCRRYEEIIINKYFLIACGIYIAICAGVTYTKIYFLDNKMIVRNLFFTKIKIDLNSYPRIFTKKYRTYERVSRSRVKMPYDIYYIYFQQKERSVKIRVYTNNILQIQMLLENFQIGDLEKVSDNVKSESASNKEDVIEEYIKNSNGKKITKIKDKSQKVKLKRTSIATLVVIVITLFIVIGMEWYVDSELDSGITFIGIYIKTGIFAVFAVLYFSEYRRIFVKISYPNDYTIKINGKKFNYIDNTVTISFMKYIEKNEINMESEKEDIVNEYVLKIEDNNNKSIKIELAKINMEDLKKFLNNIE